MVPIASFLQDPDFIRSLYIVAFICFILGLHFLNSPGTARRGNLVAAAGMAGCAAGSPRRHIVELRTTDAGEYELGQEVTVEGFADPAGSSSYNIDLSRRRAESVRQYLVGKGMTDTQLKTIGYGEGEQVADGEALVDRASHEVLGIVRQLAAHRRLPGVAVVPGVEGNHPEIFQL